MVIANQVPYGEGAVFLKVLYSDSVCSKLVGYRARKKLTTGSATAVGDWSWQSLNADRVIVSEAEANPRATVTCNACHGGYASTDYTATLP